MIEICNMELHSLVKCGLFQINLTSLNAIIQKMINKCKIELVELAPLLYNRMYDNNSEFL